MKTQLQNMRLLPAIAVNSPNITVLRALPIVLALGLYLSTLQPAHAQQTLVGGTGNIPDVGCPTNTSFTATSTAVGTLNGTDVYIASVALDIEHTYVGDLRIRLQSPAGSTLDLAINQGGNGDDYTGTVFQDGGADIASASAPFTGVFQPEGGTFASTFSGQSVTGDWTLLICDSANSDSGALLGWSITFIVGSNPVISCPSDISSCNEVVSFDPPTASDDEDGTLTATQTIGPASGSTFSTGDTLIGFSVTDSAGNTSSCQFTITVVVVDNTAPPISSCPSDITSVCSTVNYTLPTLSGSENCRFPAVPTTAPSGFSSLGTFGNSTYFISDQNTHIGTAYANAQTNGYELVTINSMAENNAIQTWAANLSGADRLLIGFNDPDFTNVDYEWQSGQPATYTNWGAGQPNDVGGNYAVMLTSSGKWDDVRGNYTGARVVIEYHDYSTGGPILVSGLPPGSTFPLGTTTNTFYAEDVFGSVSTCSFDVTITNDTVPVFTSLAGTGTATDPFTSLDPAVIGNLSGTYYFSFDGTSTPFQGVLDEGWLMVLNYVHQAGDNSALVAGNSALPLKGSSTLGDSDAGTSNWGHIGNTLANAIDFEEMRLYGQTSRDPSDIIDFTTSYTSVVDYVKTGSGSFAGINDAANYTLLPSHTASIPQNANNGFGNKGNNALTEFPFFNAGVAHWGIRGDHSRWEVDDFTTGNSLNAYSTIHRVWVRGDLSPDFSTPSITVQLGTSGSVAVAAGDFSITATDDCGTPTLSLSQSTFTCVDAGVNTVQLMATDTGGKVNSIDVEVIVENNVEDNIPPVFDTDCPADILTSTSTVTYTPPSVSDNCLFPSVPTTAPTGFTLLGTTDDGSSTYFISTQDIMPSAAFTSAQTNGYELVTINSQAEQDYLQGKLSTFGPGVRRAIIGINDISTEGTFVWQSGQPAAYTNWIGGIPSDWYPESTDYAIMDAQQGGKWLNASGNMQYFLPPHRKARMVIEYHDYSTGPILASGLPSGSTFPLGTTTTNTFYAKDASGNVTTCSFDVAYPLATGDVVISEIMQNPSDVGDANGEYFEIYNTENILLNLKGWTISDSGTDTHQITTDLLIEADSFIVLGINDDSATNGGVDVDYEYSGITMDNTSDEIILTNGSATEIDRVEYDGGTDWPNPDGAAMIYTGSSLENNNSGSLWQAATTAVGISPDLGSPGSNGTDQIVDWLVYDNGAWNKAPSRGTAEKNALVRASQALSFTSDIKLKRLVLEPDTDFTNYYWLDVADIIMESTSTEYSSLLSSTSLPGTTVTYRRHVNQTASSGGNDLISPPVTGITFDSFLAANDNIVSNTAGTLYLFGPFDKTSGTYLTYSNTATDALTSGVGYRAATTDNGTLEFSGSINEYFVQVPITDSGPAFSKWNLIGNPYPSYFNVRSFLSNTNNASILDANNVAIYGYDGDASDGWTIYNLANTTTSTVIAPGQGFFVAAGSGGNIGFAHQWRRHGDIDDFITGRSTDDNQHLRLQLSNNSAVSHTDFYFNGNSTYGLDPGYDAGVFGDVAGAFSICSRLVADDQGIDLAIQSLPQDIFASDTLIPLGINATAGEPLTVGIESSSLPQGVDIYLVDVQEQQTTHLNTEDFGITPIEDLNGTGRFYLGFSNGVLSMEAPELDRLSIYTREKRIVIEGQLMEDTDFRLYDIRGRLVMQDLLERHVMVQYIEASALNDGVYVVELNNGHKRKTYKVILN
ncbi:HYR domain-containing protein [Winogradskyella sp.]|uniref:HYR domain-containing protein n=1 Tax=Winogradskyella sp. TaxID=1883156 RepID=UPI003BAC0656